MRFEHIISILASGAIIAACDSTVTNINDEAKADGTITLRVVDNHSGAALSEVTVYSVVDDKTVVSDDLGNSTWTGCSLGDHSFQISKEGYATVQTLVSLEEQGKGDVVRVGDVVATIPMYKAGVVAKGIVLYTDDKGKVSAAKGVKVYADLPRVFVPSEVSTTTSENGEYSFENLPEGVEISIYVGQQTIGSQKYIGDDANIVSGSNYRAGDVINVSAINLEKMTAAVVKISDNTSEMSTTSKLSLTFSTELEKDSVVDSKWTVTNGSGSVVLTTVALDSDKRTIKISPYSGKWNSDTYYSVSGSVYSTEGGYTSVNTSFSVEASGDGDAPANVTDLKIEKDPDYSYYLDLTWSEPKGDIYRYNIYRMTNLNTDFVKIDYVGSSYTLYRIDLDDFSSSVTEVSYIVLPVNSNGVEADIRDAKSVTYKIEEED